MTTPAPFDWHDANQFKPSVGETVVVHELYGWAQWTGSNWISVDRCGNKGSLAWKPELWRREYHPVLPERPTQGGKL
jgi:hypothetical protein